MEKGNEQCDDKVTIKLNRGQVPILVGALRLGIYLEHWCAQWLYSVTGITDSHSAKWKRTVAYLIDEINKQTHNDKEYLENGYDDVLNALNDMVIKVCDKK